MAEASAPDRTCSASNRPSSCGKYTLTMPARASLTLRLNISSASLNKGSREVKPGRMVGMVHESKGAELDLIETIVKRKLIEVAVEDTVRMISLATSWGVFPLVSRTVTPLPPCDL